MSLAKEQAAESRVVGEGLSGRRLHSELASRVAYCAIAVLATGCTLMIDSDRQQCNTVDDCMKGLGDEVNFLGSPLSFTCEQHICREQFECTQDSDCTKVSGKSICSAGYCVGCAVSTDCASPTATCVANVCDDPKWGCLKDPDIRPAPTESTSALTAYVPNVLSKEPLSELGVRVCRASTIDATCMLPFAGTTSSYDKTTGIATIMGLEADTLYHLQLLPPTGSGLTQRDYYTNRTPRGTEMIHPDVGLVPISVLTGLTPTGMRKIDITKPFVSVRVFDCQGLPAEGVTVDVVSPPADLITVSLAEDMSLQFDLTSTTKLGYMGFINVTPNEAMTVKSSLKTETGKHELVPFQFVPIGGRTATVDLYPRVFMAR